MTASKSGHRRGFSFAPGDDSTDPSASKVPSNKNTGSQASTVATQVAVKKSTKKSEGSHQSLGITSNSGSATGLRPYRQILDSPLFVSHSDESPTSGERYGSSKSVLTAFKGGSSHSISSIAGSDNGTETGKQQRSSSFAIAAAARAAKNVSLNGQTAQRHARS